MVSSMTVPITRVYLHLDPLVFIIRTLCFPNTDVDLYDTHNRTLSREKIYKTIVYEYWWWMSSWDLFIIRCSALHNFTERTTTFAEFCYHQATGTCVCYRATFFKAVGNRAVYRQRSRMCSKRSFIKIEIFVHTRCATGRLFNTIACTDLVEHLQVTANRGFLTEHVT